jgi:putative tricarboxylic transport membrane protein
MMLEFLLILLIGLVVGVFVGLLPGIPAYLGPILLYPFIDNLSIVEILTFWLACQIGSQYFGSVAAILLKIPGEASSMVYIKDLDRISVTERYGLIRQTAWGSTVGSIVSLTVLIIIYYLGLGTELMYLTNTSVKLTALTILVSTLIYFSKHRLLALILFLIGMFLSEKTNQNYPSWVFDIQNITSDVTVFSLILGLLLLPEFLQELINKTTQQELSVIANKKKAIKWRSIFSGTWIGSLSGLIPGPSSVLSTMVAYNYKPKDKLDQRIISAESANNSATVTSLLPFLYIGLPITLSEMLLVDVFQIKLFNIPTDMHQTIGPINLIEFCFVIIAFYSIAYHFLAQKFLGGYKRLMELVYGKLIWLYLLIVAYIIYVDIQFASVNLFRYILFGILLTIIGCWVLKKNVNVLSLIFGYLLGDTILWTIYHFYMINFY